MNKRQNKKIQCWRFFEWLATFASMESKRLEVKVGLFVFVGIILLAVLVIWFSKGTSVFRGTYSIKLHAENVGGLKQRASVLLSGVNVGAVSDIQLMPDGKSVTIYLNIYNNVKIYSDAHFVIETAGFLGDQFVAIIPTANTPPLLANGASVECEPPFDLQLVARSAAGFIQRTDQTVKKIEDSVTRLQTVVLNDQTLTNLSLTIGNLRSASDRVDGAVSNLDVLVADNSGQVGLAVSNVVFFSQQLNALADNAQGILATNGVVISGAVSNLQDTTATLKQIADDVHEGKGLAGTLLENPQAAANVQAMVNNLSMVSSNLNTLGLWHILWHHEPPPANAPSRK
jgi:phospholipid/cholesterol/gamma-HCH transport system substrate-binding protein